MSGLIFRGLNYHLSLCSLLSTLFQILTKDSVTVAVDAVVYYRINNPMMSVTNVEDASRSTRLLSQTTLRNILGTKTLSEILAERESVSHLMQVTRYSCFSYFHSILNIFSNGNYTLREEYLCAGL